MSNNWVNCPECNSRTLNEDYIKNCGKCRVCCQKEKENILVEVDDHYVPWTYLNYVESDCTTSKSGFVEDVNADLPEVKWEI